jgi:hypothetical protein
MARSLLLLLRRLVFVGLVVLLLALLAGLLLLTGLRLAIDGLNGSLIRLSNIDVGHRIIFRIST